jgi:hypothetical protein
MSYMPKRCDRVETWRPGVLLAVVLVVCVAGPIAAGAENPLVINRSLLVGPPVPTTMPSGDPRKGAKVTLKLDKKQYFLGENVLLRWRVANEGNQPFKISMGGDYRGSPRALRFKIEAVDRQGRKLPDLYPNPWNMGGMGVTPLLKPGDEHRTDITLMRYRAFTKTGKYTIRVYHDLGWKTGAKASAVEAGGRTSQPGSLKPPTATIAIDLVMPDQKQARKLVTAMLAMPTRPNRTHGQWGKPYADFSLLCYSVYLPIMKDLARKGDTRALDALGAMAFPDATAVLLELTRHQDRAIATKARQMLQYRLPRPEGVGRSYWRNLAAGAWTDKLKENAMAMAWKLMDGNDAAGITTGVDLIKSLGGKDDLPKLIKVMDRILAPGKEYYFPQMGDRWPKMHWEEMIELANVLATRGGKLPAIPKTPGEAMAFLAGLKARKDFRPEGWRRTAVSLIAHKKQLIRKMALDNIPLPLDDAGIAAVAGAINDESTPVKWSACQLAERAKSPALGQAVMDTFKKASNHWVVRSLFRAAKLCGVDNDRRLDVCVDKMGLGGDRYLMLGLLLDGAIKHEGGYGSQRIKNLGDLLPGIQKAWRSFIEANRLALRDNKRFPIARGHVTSEMFPPKFVFHRKGKANWPPPRPVSPHAIDNQISVSYKFMKRSVLDRLDLWVKTRPKTPDEFKKYATELVINLDSPELLIDDRSGRIRRCGLSSRLTWTLYHITPDGAEPLKGPVRLKLRGLASQTNNCKEVFLLQGKIGGDRGVFLEITTRGLQFKAGKGVADLTSYKFAKK